MTQNPKKTTIDTSKDHLERRCPRLGGPVTFQYCRDHAGGELPCWKVFDCWWELFDVTSYFKKQLSASEYETLVNMKPKPKVLSLVDLIEQTRKNLSEET